MCKLIPMTGNWVLRTEEIKRANSTLGWNADVIRLHLTYPHLIHEFVCHRHSDARGRRQIADVNLSIVHIKRWEEGKSQLRGGNLWLLTLGRNTHLEDNVCVNSADLLGQVVIKNSLHFTHILT